MLIVDQRHQQMLEGGIFVPALARLAKGVVEGMFKLAGVTGDSGNLLIVTNVMQRARPIKARACNNPQLCVRD
jgi:hypothetical protein